MRETGICTPAATLAMPGRTLSGQEAQSRPPLVHRSQEGTCLMYIEISGDGNTVAYPAQQPDWMAWTMLILAVAGVIVPLL
jgi:hypothetical protein